MLSEKRRLTQFYAHIYARRLKEGGRDSGLLPLLLSYNLLGVDLVAEKNCLSKERTKRGITFRLPEK